MSAAAIQPASKRRKPSPLENSETSTRCSEEHDAAPSNYEEDEDEIATPGDQITVEDAACIVCGKTDNGAEMLLCDGCEVAGAHHLGCLNPPLTSAPEGDWFCPDCIKDQKDQEGKLLISFSSQNAKCSR